MANPWYAWYPADYVMKTMTLSWAEDLAYRRLLDWCYGNESGIPEGEQYECARAVTPEQVAAVDKVLGKYFELNGDGRWHQRRADREIERRRKAFERKSEGAQKANAKRWGADRVAIAKRSDSDQIALVPIPTPTTTPSSLRSEGKSKEAPSARETVSSPNPDKGLFGGPLSFLLEKGVKEARARTFLGMLQKGMGEGPALELLDRCIEKDPIDPIAWLKGGEKHYKREKERLEFHLQAFGGGGKPFQPYNGPEDEK